MSQNVALTAAGDVLGVHHVATLVGVSSDRIRRQLRDDEGSCSRFAHIAGRWLTTTDRIDAIRERLNAATTGK